jgi:hypothetical protein
VSVVVRDDDDRGIARRCFSHVPTIAVSRGARKAKPDVREGVGVRVISLGEDG